MRGLPLAAAVTGLALLTFIQFPGHTWLQQDSQIYAPILEHLRDPSVLRNDPVAQHPHVAFTLYDEVALALRRLTGAGFREVLQAQQIATRALGIWGLYLLAEALGLSLWPALGVAAICSLGALIAGPQVLTFEYEPTPRAFAVPLLFCAIGLASRQRWMAASLAGAAAFLYHPPTTIPFWAIFGILLVMRGKWRELAVPVAAAVLLLVAARLQGDGNTPFFARLGPFDEQVQRFRASYVWISTWPLSHILHHALLLAVVVAAFLRIRGKAGVEASAFLLGLPIIGILSMPASWVLLERMKWSLIPQVQPMRALLFIAIFAQLLAAVAAFRAPTRIEAFAWFTVAFLASVQPVLAGPWASRGAVVALALGAICCIGPGFALPAALAAFFLFPTIGGIRNYPHLHSAELAELSAWARTSTPKDAVFLFADAGRGLDSGIFRSEGLRAVYVDWKAGGQVNYLSAFGEQWWFRWQQTLARRFRPSDLSRYGGLGIQYVVLQPKNRVAAVPEFANFRYLVYRVQ